MARRTAGLLAAVAIGTATLTGGAAAAMSDGDPAGGPGRGCVGAFDAAARVDMEAFRDYDARTWRQVHHPEAQTVVASGQRVAGIDNIMRAMRGHFEGREAVFEWTEVSRFIDDTCHSGFVVYETRYRLDSIGFDQQALTTVSLVKEKGRWQVIYDQGRELPD